MKLKKFYISYVRASEEGFHVYGSRIVVSALMVEAIIQDVIKEAKSCPIIKEAKSYATDAVTIMTIIELQEVNLSAANQVAEPQRQTSVTPERMMEIWNECIDEAGSNIIKFSYALIAEDRGSRG